MQDYTALLGIFIVLAVGGEERSRLFLARNQKKGVYPNLAKPSGSISEGSVSR